MDLRIALAGNPNSGKTTLFNAGLADTATYALLSGLADAPFFFRPIFAAYGAAKRCVEETGPLLPPCL